MEKGDFVKITYVARVKDTNSVFDTNIEEVARAEGIHTENATYGPTTIVLGARHVIPGLEKALLTMDVGGEKEVDIQPADAFGRRNRALITIVPLREFKKHRLLPRVGMRMEINNRWATVRSVSSGRVILDFNHPLSGKIVHYTVHLLEKVEDTKMQIEALLRLLGIKPEVIPDEEGFLIKIGSLQKGKEKETQNLVKRNVKKFIPGAKISFAT